MTLGRLVTLAIAAALALAMTGPAHSTGAGEIFRVRPDLRMCPSPLCGGFWVSRVNRATTTCGDGTARAWCYVAEINRPVPAGRSSGDILVRGRIVRVGSGEIRPLDRLVANQAWLAATRASASGAVYLVTDSGIRCVRAPCFSLRTSTVNTTRTATASGLDLSAVGAAPAIARKAKLALTRGGLLVAATIRRDADGGRTAVASQFFLAAN